MQALFQAPLLIVSHLILTVFLRRYCYHLHLQIKKSGTERVGKLPKITVSKFRTGIKHRWSGSRAHLLNSHTLLPPLKTYWLTSLLLLLLSPKQGNSRSLFMNYVFIYQFNEYLSSIFIARHYPGHLGIQLWKRQSHFLSSWSFLPTGEHSQVNR